MTSHGSAHWRSVVVIVATLLLISPPSHASPGFVSTVAGGGVGDGGAATAAVFRLPMGVARAANGDIFVADLEDNRVRRIDASGTVTTVAGTGFAGFLGDGGPATEANLAEPSDVAVDPAGNLFVADTFNNRIRRIDAETGDISTVAGVDPEITSSLGGATPADHVPALAVRLHLPSGVAFFGGRLYIADSPNNRVLSVGPDGLTALVAGTGDRGFSGDGGPAGSARLYNPRGIAGDSAGNLYIADNGNSRVRRVAPDGIITTIAGTGSTGFSGDGGPATAAGLSVLDVDSDADGALLITDLANGRIRAIDPSGIITTVAGSGTSFSGDGGPATTAGIDNVGSVVREPGGGFTFTASGIVGQTRISRVRRVSAGGTITTIAGGNPMFSGDGGPATQATLSYPTGVARDGSGTLYIADYANHRLRKVDPSGVISTIAGTGVAGSTGDGGPAIAATLNRPFGIALDQHGDVFVSEFYGYRVRMITPEGVISTVAGGGTASGDGIPATSASLLPRGIAIDEEGSLYIATDQVIRRVTAGIITTVAGNGDKGYSGDGGPATSASLWYPQGVAVRSGYIYIADTGNGVIRRVSPSGTITTIAGGELPRYRGGPVPRNSLPLGVAVDQFGTVYFSEEFFPPAGTFTAPYGRIRRVDPDGNIVTISGAPWIIRPIPGRDTRGDGSPLALYDQPSGIALDASGDVWVADSVNNRIRFLEAMPH